MTFNEFDLWWLLRRKQRERYTDSRVFFYERRPKAGFKEARHLLLQSYGVQICDVNTTDNEDYALFYSRAFDDIREKIDVSRRKV